VSDMREGVRLLAQYSDDVILEDLTESAFDAFFNNPVWKVFKLGVARSINAAYSAMEHPQTSTDTWRFAQGVISAAAPWLDTEARLRNQIRAYQERIKYKGSNPAGANEKANQKEDIDDLFSQIANRPVE